MARRRASTVEPARARILRAARSCFAEQGFAGASTREIARRARVQQGLLRHYFGDKEALFRAVVEGGVAALGDELALAPEPGVATVLHALSRERELLSVLAHALLEPGARRDWLLSTQLPGLESKVIEALARPSAQRPSAAGFALWLAAAATSGALTDLWPKEAPREHRQVLERWLEPAARAPGPWSLQAGLARRGGAAHFSLAPATRDRFP